MFDDFTVKSEATKGRELYKTLEEHCEEVRVDEEPYKRICFVTPDVLPAQSSIVQAITKSDHVISEKGMFEEDGHMWVELAPESEVDRTEDPTNGNKHV